MPENAGGEPEADVLSALEANMSYEEYVKLTRAEALIEFNRRVEAFMATWDAS